METAKWDRFVAGRWTDEEDEAQRQKMKKERLNGNGNGNGNGRGEGTPKQMAARQMMLWVGQVKKEAENSLCGLQALTEEEVWQLFGASDARADVEADQKSIASARHGLVLRRWIQILDTSCKALKSLESDS